MKTTPINGATLSPVPAIQKFLDHDGGGSQLTALTKDLLKAQMDLSRVLTTVNEESDREYDWLKNAMTIIAYVYDEFQIMQEGIEEYVEVMNELKGGQA